MADKVIQRSWNRIGLYVNTDKNNLFLIWFCLLWFFSMSGYHMHGITTKNMFKWRTVLYRVSQKKRNGGFSVPCELEMSYLFTSLDQTSSAEENDTKIIKFGWVVLIQCPFLEIRSISKFARFLRPMSEELCREQPFIIVPWGIPLNRVSFVDTDQWASLKTQQWKAIPNIILRSSVAKIKRNSKMTVFQEMVIESKLLIQI